MSMMSKMMGMSTKGTQVDMVPNAQGRFGYNKTNPIPVEDQLGQLHYLACLRCPCGEPFDFHRLGNFGSGPDGHVIDGYEIICKNRNHKFFLYMDMYHQGPSTLLPEGLSQGEPEGVGVPFHVNDFPEGLADFFENEERLHEEDEDGMFMRTMRSMEPAVCMHCQHEQDFAVYQTVNATLNPELREELLNYRFSVLTCAECGKETKINYSFLYYDITSKCWCWYDAEESDQPFDVREMCSMMEKMAKEDQSEAGERLNKIYHGCHCRIVRHPLELNEKFRLFEDGFDDRIMEIFKLFALIKDSEFFAENDVNSLYYSGSFDGALQFIAMGDNEAGMIQLSPEGYKDIFSRFADQLPDMNSTLGQYLEIDRNYAVGFLKEFTAENKKRSGGMFSRFTSWFRRN